ISSPIVNISSGTTIGFRYLNFGDRSPSDVSVRINALTDVSLKVIMDSYDGEIVGLSEIPKTNGFSEFVVPLTKKFHGKHAVYFCFTAIKRENIAEFDCFSFEIL
ncbi:MAG: carbohydrate-binding protein, partial [Lachnospiraceae bacterium]|nr:carbohydrate-binding protein [Lachnospiraceae bacterium]